MGWSRVVTAAASVITAAVLWALLPRLGAGTAAGLPDVIWQTRRRQRHRPPARVPGISALCSRMWTLAVDNHDGSACPVERHPVRHGEGGRCGALLAVRRCRHGDVVAGRFGLATPRTSTISDCRPAEGRYAVA